jgi:hypothetical protein
LPNVVTPIPSPAVPEEEDCEEDEISSPTPSGVIPEATQLPNVVTPIPSPAVPEEEDCEEDEISSPTPSGAIPEATQLPVGQTSTPSGYGADPLPTDSNAQSTYGAILSGSDSVSFSLAALAAVVFAL